MFIGGGWVEGEQSSNVSHDSEVDASSILIGGGPVIFPSGREILIIALLFVNKDRDGFSVLSWNSSVIVRHFKIR